MENLPSSSLCAAQRSAWAAIALAEKFLPQTGQAGRALSCALDATLDASVPSIGDLSRSRLGLRDCGK